jgi:hypothetical protein
MRAPRFAMRTARFAMRAPRFAMRTARFAYVTQTMAIVELRWDGEMLTKGSVYEGFGPFRV